MKTAPSVPTYKTITLCNNVVRQQMNSAFKKATALNKLETV